MVSNQLNRRYFHIGIHACILVYLHTRRLVSQTETETRVVSRLVSGFETTCQKSQYQSQNLRLIPQVSLSVPNFETKMQKSQNAIVCLAHHRFCNPQRKLISWQLFINFNVRMCVQCQIKLLFLSKSKVSVSVSMFETDDGLSLSLNFWYQRQ